MKDKSKLTAIILCIVAIVIVVVNFIVDNKEQEKKEIFIVTNASNFYTVNSCLYRVTTYISSKDSESLLLLLSDDYKKKNQITKENVLELFFEANDTSTFISEKMYYEYFSEDVNKYYVQGYVQENQLFDDELLYGQDSELVYFIVYLDSNENIFSIEPYDGKIFKEALDEE